MSRPMRKNGALSFDKIEKLYEEILKPIFESYYEAIEKGNATDYFKGKSGVSISGKEEKKIQKSEREFEEIRKREGEGVKNTNGKKRRIEERKGGDSFHSPLIFINFFLNIFY